MIFQAIPKPVIRHEPVKGRVGGATAPATNCPHAAMVLVHRRNLDGTNTAALGGGSIISTRHLLTAAHLVQGDNIRYQIGFIVGSSRRLVDSNFRLMHEEYNNEDFSNDIALLFLQGTATFPLASAIIITNTVDMPTGGPFSLVGFGFTAANSTGASSDPFEAIQTVETACTFENFEQAASHFCAIDSGSTVVCPGDNGAGLFQRGAVPEEVAENRLVIFSLLSCLLKISIYMFVIVWCGVTNFTWMHNTTKHWLHLCRSIYRLDHKCYRHSCSHIDCKRQ